MTPTQKGRRSDALYMDTRTTHRRQLCDMVVNREADIEDLKEEIYGLQCDIGRLENENTKLQEQMERLISLLRNDCDIDASWDGLRGFWSIELTEDGCLMRDRACKAEAENAKLRELLQRLLTEYRYMRIRPRRVYLQHEERMRAIEEEMRELGIEVDG